MHLCLLGKLNFPIGQKMLKGMSKMAEKKKKDKDRGKYTLSSMQEVAYQREFKRADRAGGYTDRKTKL